MRRSSHYYLVEMQLIGLSVFGVSLGLLAAIGVSFFGLALIIMTVFSGWIRIDLDPAGHIDIIPFMMFVTLLLASPFTALFASVAAAFASARFLLNKSLSEAATETGEQGLVTLAIVGLAGWTGLTSAKLLSTEGLLAFLLVTSVYALGKIVLTAVRASLIEGIGAISFIREGGKYMAVHPLAMGALAMGLTLWYPRAGYLVLPLAAIALIELHLPGRLVRDQSDTLFASLGALAQAIDLKDQYTHSHLYDVEAIAVRTARAMGLPEAEVKRIRIGAVMHDIGKVGVSAKIIRKPGPLNPAEWDKMKQHPVIGAEIMQPIELLSEAAEIVRHCHEHYDGSGYPDGLRGDAIPLGSRIILVADAFHAMTSDRSYRKARPREEALRELIRCAGKQFDKKVVDAFGSVVDTISPVKLTRPKHVS